jgi:hypothetical protein
MAESKARGFLRELAAFGSLPPLPEDLKAQVLVEAAREQGVSGLSRRARARPARVGGLLVGPRLRAPPAPGPTLAQVGLAARPSTSSPRGHPRLP